MMNSLLLEYAITVERREQRDNDHHVDGHTRNRDHQVRRMYSAWRLRRRRKCRERGLCPE